jgi:preprotein translocase subunit SecG
MPEEKKEKVIGKNEGILALVFFAIALVLGLISQ